MTEQNVPVCSVVSAKEEEQDGPAGVQPAVRPLSCGYACGMLPTFKLVEFVKRGLVHLPNFTNNVESSAFCRQQVRNIISAQRCFAHEK